MNREIKFRAWDSVNEVMELNIHHLDSLNEILHKGKYNVMQFTGYLDKNKKEIYEGDILKGCYINGSKAAVIFTSGCFCVYSMRADIISFDTFKEMSYSIKNSEIIGNIYENPKILNGC